MCADWVKHYQAGRPEDWLISTVRADDNPLCQHINIVDLAHDAIADIPQESFVILGFACDAGIKRNGGRIGAKQGPKALRRALGRLPLQQELPFHCYDVGTIICNRDNLEASQAALADVIALLQQRRLRTIILGGGHETAWGHYQGLAKAHPNEPIGIINFDAHFDLRPLLADNKGHSGSPFFQISEYNQQLDLPFDYTCIGIQQSANSAALFAKAKQLGCHYVLAEDLLFNNSEHCVSLLDDIINRNDQLYLSICMDVFATSVAPGVSAPQINGLQPHHVVEILRYILQSLRVLSIDVVELSPPLDNNDQTAKLAALLVWEYLHHSSASAK